MRECGSGHWHPLVPEPYGHEGWDPLCPSGRRGLVQENCKHAAQRYSAESDMGSALLDRSLLLEQASPALLLRLARRQAHTSEGLLTFYSPMPFKNKRGFTVHTHAQYKVMWHLVVIANWDVPIFKSTGLKISSPRRKNPQKQKRSRLL